MNTNFLQNQIYTLFSKYLGESSMYLTFDSDDKKNQTQYQCCNSKCPSLSKNKKKLEINYDKCLYHCWVCGISGKLDKLAKRLFNTADLIDFVNAYGVYTGTSSYSKFISDDNINYVATSKVLTLPNNIVPIGELTSNDMTSKIIYSYLHSRGVDDLVTDYNMFYCYTGKYANRIVIPSYNFDAELNYFITRDLTDGPGKHYDDAQVERNTIVFCEHLIDYSKELIIVEGPFDYLQLHGHNRTALLGSYIAPNYDLFYKILSNQTSIAIYLDQDAKHKALNMAKLFVSYGIPCRIIHDDLYKDPGCTPRDRIKELINDIEKSPAINSKLDFLQYKIHDMK